MPTASSAIDAAIKEVTNARALVTKVKTKQVSKGELLVTLKSTALSWFNTHRKVLVASGIRFDLAAIDEPYTTILNATTKHAARQTYLDALKEAKRVLTNMHTVALTALPSSIASSTDDVPPDFSPLAGNQEMRDILSRRWEECCRCVNAEAHLAAIVMMGGLLEALFVGRANKMTDKKPLISAKAAPKDKNGKTLNYQEWMLDSYIKVANELTWITDSAKSVADVLKEYRNYVHPEKELRHGVNLSLNDSSMFWQVTKSLARQLLVSCRTV